ncbi:hypothetical protein DD559_08480 [Sphingomonas pokkalii]|uniref:Uncharacterized protein n=1 Tax=Sphingomonas pokkalii TaxID=2175090 RepID=A0A2U0SDE8_9SPHN|nr:hypothetical protein DD559_08480 [Sphingomonas pokkalii]
MFVVLLVIDPSSRELGPPTSPSRFRRPRGAVAKLHPKRAFTASKRPRGQNARSVCERAPCVCDLILPLSGGHLSRNGSRRRLRKQ